MLNRREFIKASAVLLPSVKIPVSLSHQSVPHFHLSVFFQGGWEVAYMFDTRSIEMTKNNLIHNHINKLRKPWQGRNKTILVYDHMDPLRPFIQDFSIIRGVHMSAALDGHRENLNLFYTGNPFGGNYYLSLLNNFPENIFLNYLNNDSSGPDIANYKKGMSFSPTMFQQFVSAIKTNKNEQSQNYIDQYLLNTYSRLSKGSGTFSQGVHSLTDALKGRNDLKTILSNVKDIDPKLSLEERNILMAINCFQSGLTHNVNLELDYALDSHDKAAVKLWPKKMESIVNMISKVLKIFKTTPYNDQLSFLDVTTISFMSEFSRTMRQANKPVNDSGTDHNPQNNTVLLAGKGIAGGLIIGESDFQMPNEQLSAAHLNKDKGKNRLMGRPFDFKSMDTDQRLPQTYKEEDYITSASIMNTIYSAYKTVDKKHFRTIGENQITAPVITTLLT